MIPIQHHISFFTYTLPDPFALKGDLKTIISAATWGLASGTTQGDPSILSITSFLEATGATRVVVAWRVWATQGPGSYLRAWKESGPVFGGKQLRPSKAVNSKLHMFWYLESRRQALFEDNLEKSLISKSQS